MSSTIQRYDGVYKETHYGNEEEWWMFIGMDIPIYTEQEEMMAKALSQSPYKQYLDDVSNDHYGSFIIRMELDDKQYKKLAKKYKKTEESEVYEELALEVRTWLIDYIPAEYEALAMWSVWGENEEYMNTDSAEEYAEMKEDVCVSAGYTWDEKDTIEAKKDWLEARMDYYKQEKRRKVAAK